MSTSASDVLGKLQTAIQSWIVILPNIAVLIGVILIIYSLMILAKAGQPTRTANTHPLAIAGGLVGGIFLINFHSFLDVISMSIFNKQSYDVFQSVEFVKSQNVDAAYIKTSIVIIVLVGIFSVIKGCTMLNKVMDQNTTGLWAAITHIGGGILAINIIQVIKVLSATFQGTFIQEKIDGFFNLSASVLHHINYVV